MTAVLSAITLPSNISTEVSHLQHVLYSKYCMVSALALPPLIPLSFHPHSFSEKDFTHVVENITHGFRVTLGRLCYEKNALFISVNTKGKWKALRRKFSSTATDEFCTILPIFEGIFLALNEKKRHDYGLPMCNLIRLKGFHSPSLALLEIEGACQKWWSEVFWTVCLEKKMRKPAAKPSVKPAAKPSVKPIDGSAFKRRPNNYNDQKNW